MSSAPSILKAIDLAQADDGVVETTPGDIKNLAWWACLYGVDIAYPLVEWHNFVKWLYKEARKYEASIEEEI